MKKKFIFSILAVITLLCTSCGNSKKEDDTTPTDETVQGPTSTDADVLDAWFEEQAYVPEIVDASITLPKKLPSLGNSLTWTIEQGSGYLKLSKNVLSAKKSIAAVGCVHEIKVSVAKTDYSYTYYCTSHVANNRDLPIIDIRTDDGIFPTNKEDYVDGHISIIDYKDEKYSIALEGAEMGIRLRGNSTMGAPKKPFRIKFDKKQSLFGLTKAKSWVLLANYYDKSNIRNYLAYNMANRMEHLGFQPSAIFVEVIFNGSYIGLYLLSEQMQTGEGRVDIEDLVDDEGNPSYFLEQNVRAKDEAGQVENETYFTMNNGTYVYEYKFPEPVTAEQNEYIKNYFEETENAIKNKSNYEKYIDVNSFIDYYLVQELFKNVDVASTSQYYVKYANGKLHMGPVWDFDICAFVVGYDDQDGTYWSYENVPLYVRETDRWFRWLFEDSVFLSQVKTRYTEIRNTVVNQIMDDYSYITEHLKKAQEANLRVWPMEYKSEANLWIERYYHSEYKKLTTVEEHYQYLKDHIVKRVKLLDDTYLRK